jgi:hypothetical protein
MLKGLILYSCHSMSDEVTNMAISVMDVQIGHHFSIKVIKKLMLSKNANKKNVLLIGIFR